ncbi:uncharacterized protein Dwil_GK20456 [Drosophila willistoni]|nr:uncharacterized protein Dwil_GK20456 [Drosophila willistoni]
MSSWAERVHRRAADLGNVVTSCGHPATSPSYPYRLEKVKFGVPLEEVCKHNNNIPGPLLVLILKLNKESPNRRDVFRAPGHQGAMKKLIHFLQAGRLVNVDNYSVFTIASVLKKFLRKIPNGIFGRQGEMELFSINELQNEAEQTERLHRLFGSLPKYTQHLLVLLFGTFRVIASNAAHASTGMTSEALGVSVAPSFFQSCVSDGKTARMEDVLKFKVATKIMQHIIDKFATHDIFGRENYEYYARVTGRILKVQDEWICSFQYPPPPRGKLAQQKYALQHSLEAEKTWLQCQCERWGLLAQEESRSTPALLTSSSSALENSVLSLGVSPEHSFIESCARLSVSLEGPGIFAMTSSPLPAKRQQHQHYDYDYDDYEDEDNDELDGSLGLGLGHGHGQHAHGHDFAAELELSHIAPPPPLPTRGTIGGGFLRHKQRHDDDDDDDDDEDEEEVVMKRRYRQNKKKNLTTTSSSHHQRRLRAGTKSLDGQAGGAGGGGGASAAAASVGVGGAASTVPQATPPKLKPRTCSRCNRGIRHSSSCSSNSGGAATGSSGGNGGNNGGMTMEELRAVNRYAESTKSLSYLPQVHERQTARMRTRSEWFLGPRDAAVVSLQLPLDTCSNCCLAAAAAAAGYLGGGSTRDMRQGAVTAAARGGIGGGGVGAGGAGLVGIGGGSAQLYHFYRKQQHLDDMMDTEDSYSQQQQQQLIQQEQLHSKSGGLLRPPPTLLTAGGSAGQQTNRRLLLDANSVGNIRLSNSAESIQYAARRPHANNIAIGIGGGIGIGGAGGGGVGVGGMGGNNNNNNNNNNNSTNLQHQLNTQFGQNLSTTTTTSSSSQQRRLLINVPRQYRSSLRRNKEKQIGGGSGGANTQSNSSNSLGSDPIGTNLPPPLNKPLLMVGLLPGAEQPPSVRNSIAECGGGGLGIGLVDGDHQMDTLDPHPHTQLATSSSTTTLSFKPPRL